MNKQKVATAEIRKPSYNENQHQQTT